MKRASLDTPQHIFNFFLQTSISRQDIVYEHDEEDEGEDDDQQEGDDDGHHA